MLPAMQLAPIRARAGQKKVSATLGALLAVATGCGPSVQRLYPHPEIPRRLDEIATLSGPFASIDEAPVSARGHVFHVLPGCHVLRLMDQLGEMNDQGSGGWSARLPPLVYAIEVKPGHAYSIDIDARGGTGHFGQMMIMAIDRAPDGAATTIPPTIDPKDVRACLRGGPSDLLAPDWGEREPKTQARIQISPEVPPGSGAPR
jgi:hypothetical protein